jgi:hypothetical protein
MTGDASSNPLLQAPRAYTGHGAPKSSAESYCAVNVDVD